MSESGRRISPLISRIQKNTPTAIMAVTLMAGIIIAATPARQVEAAQITIRSLTLQSGGTDGGSKPGGTVNHRFAFTVPTTASVGSIKFEYCTTASVATCVTPTGLSTTGVTLGGSTGAVFTSTVSSSANAAYISRTAASITSGQVVTATLNSIINPSTTNSTFFVRISTHAATNGTGSAIDTGSVAASTATVIVLSGTMPESLIFCTGATIGTTSSIPDCTTATAGTVAFDQLFSPTDTATARSQMAASTNASGGYAITVNGPTLTSGSNTITAITAPTASTIGIGQFGMNLRANTTVFDNQTTPVALGTNVAPAANGTNYKGQPATIYNADNQFGFTTGNTVAASDNGGVGGADSQIFTVSYIVNVSGSQPAGTYVSTLTFICTPTF